MAAYEDWNRVDDDEDEELEDTAVSTSPLYRSICINDYQVVRRET